MISGRFVSGKKLEIVHLDSGTILVTDAPRDNNGEGTSFSPTDLAAASLPACMITVMAIAAEKEGIPFHLATFSLTKQMGIGPRRIAKLVVDIHLSQSLTADSRNVLEKAAHDCPIHHSLSERVIQEIVFHYDLPQTATS
jgi:putative redox protein